MKTRIFSASLLAALCCLLSAPISFAQSSISTSDIPRTISYQGKLTNTDGSPVLDGTYPITVSLCANADGSGKVWQETYSTSVTGGVFSLYLGSGNTPLPDPAIMNAPLWIATQIGDAPQMSPLSPLSASPYALNVSNGAISTEKLADGAVTAKKVDMPYVSGIEINDQKVSGVGTVLKLKSSDDIALNYDEATNSVTIASKSGAASGNSRDPEKGGSPLATNYLTSNNWLGRDAGANLPFYDVPNGTTSTYNTLAGGYANRIRINADYSVIPGGEGNEIDTNSDYSHIGGGYYNTTSGSYNTIGGGEHNLTSGLDATVGGGYGNTAGSIAATVAGGDINQATGLAATVGGGYTNVVSQDFSVIAGGDSNTVTGLNGFIGGGHLNRVYSNYATVAGGESNHINASSSYSFVGGGQYNNISNGGDGQTIGGGISNYTIDAPLATIAGGHRNTIQWADHGTIGGGYSNVVLGDSGTVAGGQFNVVNTVGGFVGGGARNATGGINAIVGGGEENFADGDVSTIAGGDSNTITAAEAFIGGGFHNTISGIGAVIGGGGSNEATNTYAVIGGGYDNFVSGRDATISGGEKNFVSANFAVIGGGYRNTAVGHLSTIGGGIVNRTANDYASIGGGYANDATGWAAAIPGGDSLQATNYAQTTIGFYNAPRGFVAAQPTTAAKATINDPLFMVGNGTAGLIGGPVVRSNAFEVSYNGHSVVYDVNGTSNIAAITHRDPIRGATYVDNIVYAWGDVDAMGGVNADFGVASVIHTGPGTYLVRISLLSPQGAAILLNNASITANVVIDGVEPSVPCLVIYPSRIAGNQFTIRIKNVTNCLPQDAPFMFKVTGRP